MKEIKFLKKLLLLVLFVSNTLVGLSQNNTDCGCDKLTKSEQEQLSVSKEAEIIFSYPNGKVKYKEIKKGPKIHIICYQQTGDKCRELFINSRTQIKKTIHYDPMGKKQMVCKGNLKS